MFITSCAFFQVPSKKVMTTKEQIAELSVFLTIFENPDFKYIIGSGGGKKTESGAITMPYPVYAPEVLKFYSLAGQEFWSDYQYNPQAAGKMLKDDAFIAQADLKQLKTMITYCVRGERFSDGHWSQMLETGRIQAILKRLQVLQENLL